MIRPALPHDVRRIIELGEEARKEMGKFDPIDHKRIYEMSSHWFLLPEQCLALVAEDNNKIVGMLISSMTENLWSGYRSAACHTLYTLPSHRNKSAYLIKYWVRWAKAVNAKRAVMILEGDKNDIRLRKMLSIIGFEEDGTKFSMDLNNGH